MADESKSEFFSNVEIGKGRVVIPLPDGVMDRMAFSSPYSAEGPFTLILTVSKNRSAAEVLDKDGNSLCWLERIT